MVFTRYLQNGRKRARVRLHPIPDPLRYMLIDQQNGDVLAARSKGVKGLGDGGVGGGIGDY